MIKQVFFFILILFAFTACEEVVQPLPDLQIESDRRVLLEEFSGGNCKPCADAAAEIENLLGIHGENLIVVTMHTFIPTPQAEPAPDATYDFRTNKGTDIINSLGVPFGIPTAAVNRRPLGINGARLISPFSAWAGDIGDELQRPPVIQVGIETSFDASSNQLDIGVNMIPNENLSGDLRLTVMIAENKITDKQLTGDGVVDFSHKHILRDVISSIQGDNIANSLNANELTTKNYSYTIPEEDAGGPWEIQNCEIIAFVTLVDEAAGEQEVLQAAQAGVAQ